MEEYIEKNGFLIWITEYGYIRKLRIVKKIPRGYHVWNIGNNIKDGYLPLCVCDENYHINESSLLVIKTKHAQTILSSVCMVGDDIRKMERYIQTHNDIFSKRMKKAIPLIKELKE